MKTQQVAIFAAILVSTALLFRTALGTVANLAFHDDRYVQIALAPLLCAFLLFWERTRIFPLARYSPRQGIPLLVSAVLLGLFLDQRTGMTSSGIALGTALLIVAWMMAFLLCWGLRSFRAALFPLCCLFLMIPPPAALLDRITAGLQSASTSMSYWMFRLAGMPIFAEGTRFSLPGLDIDIQPECSGIRSTLALTLMALLVGRLFLRSGWRQLALVFVAIAISVFKNAARITVIASLGAYVNRAFLHGSLHRNGGVVFTLLGIAMFMPLLSALQRSDLYHAERRP
jgi:exosortase